MAKSQDINAFYAHKFEQPPKLPALEAGGFNVFSLEETRIGNAATVPYARYDFFKIMFIQGRHRCHFADKSINIQGDTMLFFNPSTPYKFERLDSKSIGYFCIFKETFYTKSSRSSIKDFPMFTPGGKSAYNLKPGQCQDVIAIFKKMMIENHSDYRFKYDLLYNYVAELIHLALKLEPEEQLFHHPDTNARITSIFVSLLESQFPIDALERTVSLRTASDFANKLGVHVNHLNRAVRKTTGKTTSALISARIASEATALLKHTNWNISEISDCLGFVQPSHFTYFYKKQTNATPTSVRFV